MKELYRLVFIWKCDFYNKYWWFRSGLLNHITGDKSDKTIQKPYEIIKSLISIKKHIEELNKIFNEELEKFNKENESNINFN